MSTEKARWAKLAGLPKPTDKQQLDENFVGTQMVGNIFDREKEQYEDAFEHFLSERYEEKLEEEISSKQLTSDNIKEDESEFERNTPFRINQFIKELDALIEEYHAELYLKDDVFTGIEAVKMAALGENTAQD